jgi:hypothetical protein
MGFFVLLIVWAITTVVAELIRPKPDIENAKPADLGDFQFPTATEGRSVPIIWGTVKIAGPNVVWYGDFRKEAITEEVKTGMFSSEEVVTGYRYYVGIQFALCRGPVDSVNEIWIKDKRTSSFRGASGLLGINAPTIQGGEEHGTGGVIGNGYWYDGDPDTQAVDTYLTNHQDPLPAYRGTCYYVFYGGYVGTSPNISKWAFELTRIPNGLNLTTPEVNDDDANPMNVLYEILTDPDWGLAISPSLIDATNFSTAAATLASEGNGFSFTLDGEMKADELIRLLTDQIDGVLYFDRANGQWKIKLARDDYDPGDLPIFDESNIVELTDYTRQTWDETTNQVRVSFTDRDDEYKKTFALAQDMGNALIQVSNVSGDLRYPGVKDRDLANQIAWRELRSRSYPLAKVNLIINRLAFDLRPGDSFRLTWARLGITEVVFRVARITPGTIENGQINISAVQDIFATEAGSFGAPTGSGWAGPVSEAVAVDTDETLVFEAPRQLVVQDPVSPTNLKRLWAGARFPGGGTLNMQIFLRTSSAQPITTDYIEDAIVNRFLLAGSLTNDIDAYGATASRPDSTYNIDINGNDPDDLSSLIRDGNATDVTGLFHIVYIDGEFIGYQDVQDLGGGDVRLTALYRGLFHTAPKAHAADTRVWFLGQGGGGLTQASIPSAHDESDLQLRSKDVENTVAEIDTPVEETTLINLWAAPLAPRDPIINGSYADDTVSADVQYTTETGRTGDDARAIEVEVTPRAWRVDNVLGDATLSASPVPYLDDDPEFDFNLILDPTGTPVETDVVTIDSTDEPTAYILRNDIIKALGVDTNIPSEARIQVVARHTPLESGGTPITNPVPMLFDITLSSSLQGSDIVHGGIPVTTVSDVVTYGETGNYSFDIGTALPSNGILQARLNGGSFTTVVAATQSTGTLSVTANDDVELWFTQAPANDQFFTVTGPTAETGYGVLQS